MKSIGKLLTLGLLLMVGEAVFAQAQKKAPYWASINEVEARMRTGPSTEFPVKWVYKRQNLPVKVVAVHSVWRKVEDPDGDQGWMHVRLLSPTRTAVVIGSGIGVLREKAEPTARIAWRVEPSVVGTIDDCLNGWCRFENAGRAGYIEADRLWGDEAP
ncbi:MAG: SH3 domain-containing protein [Sphingorhabdus sp.]